MRVHDSVNAEGMVSLFQDDALPTDGKADVGETIR